MNAPASTLPPFRITDGDIAILEAIARYRLLSPPLLLRIVGGSERGVRNRLRLLTIHKYIVRLPAKITEPLAYGLANNGARLVAERGSNINPTGRPQIIAVITSEPTPLRSPTRCYTSSMRPTRTPSAFSIIMTYSRTYLNKQRRRLDRSLCMSPSATTTSH
jgi:hypothetical protein